jgi:hypothetical protein
LPGRLTQLKTNGQFERRRLPLSGSFAFPLDIL